MTRNKLHAVLACLATIGAAFSVRAQSPTHACPQFKWGETGGIHHYYATFLHAGDPCQDLDPGNFDSGAELTPDELGGHCGDLDRCQELAKIARRTRTQRLGLESPLAVNAMPQLMPGVQPGTGFKPPVFVQVVDGGVVLFAAKLFSVTVDPKKAGKRGDPLTLREGFEVQRNTPPPHTVQVPAKTVTNEGDVSYLTVDGNKFVVRRVKKTAGRKTTGKPLTALKGSDPVPEPDFEMPLDAAASVVDKKIVDVMIAPQRVIKAKIYLLLIDPRVHGIQRPPIYVAKGFEVRYDPSYPPYMTVSPQQVQKVAENRYLLKIGVVPYLLETHEEGKSAAPDKVQAKKAGSAKKPPTRKPTPAPKPLKKQSPQKAAPAKKPIKKPAAQSSSGGK